MEMIAFLLFVTLCVTISDKICGDE